MTDKKTKKNPKGGKNGHDRNQDDHGQGNHSESESESVHEGSVTSCQSSRIIEGYNSGDEGENGVDGCVGDDPLYMDDFEDKLIEAIDSVSQTSSSKGRQGTFDSIAKAFTSRYLYDFVQDRYVSLPS